MMVIHNRFMAIMEGNHQIIKFGSTPFIDRTTFDLGLVQSIEAIPHIYTTATIGKPNGYSSAH